MRWNRISLEDTGPLSIPHTLYSRPLNNNGVKSPHIGICICIHTKVLWKQFRSRDVFLPHS
ncbi:unnamed protein product [Hymenolepis diminuta]|uniref:Uncharacterized protein n=1 Tax=Hymenolepis diminuta TaxID=6216 RepID=A0A564Z8Y2_HYMDI|nr:unnamed protein product [Hymenolepis diminuta]VUZ55959.1 unnamed protein product [Hymenolepis diminuta]